MKLFSWTSLGKLIVFYFPNISKFIIFLLFKTSSFVHAHIHRMVCVLTHWLHGHLVIRRTQCVKYRMLVNFVFCFKCYHRLLLFSSCYSELSRACHKFVWHVTVLISPTYLKKKWTQTICLTIHNCTRDSVIVGNRIPSNKKLIHVYELMLF